MGRRVLLMAGLMSLAACGDPGNNVTGDSQQLYEQYCSTAFRCCSRGEVDDLMGPFVNEENCADRFAQVTRLRSGIVSFSLPIEDWGFALPNAELLEQAVDDGRAQLVAGVVDECIEFLDAIACNTVEEEEEEEACVPREPIPDGPCDLDAMIQGKVAEGGDCTSFETSFECKEGLRCIEVSSLGNEGVCVEPGEVGDYCYADFDCSLEMFCNVLDGLCEELHTEGQPCEFIDPDDPNPDPRSTSRGGDVVIQCQEHLSCDPVADVCVSDCVQGAPCQSDAQCDEEAGLQCLLIEGRGRCDVLRGVGLPCASTMHCSEGLYCGPNPAAPDANICLSTIADGETCATHEHCASGFCFYNGVSQSCRAKVADGSACVSRNSTECESGYCEVRNVNEITNAYPYPNSSYGFCSGDEECPGASTCDLTRNRCTELCRAQAADGVDCAMSSECISEFCAGVQAYSVLGQCQTLPLPDGASCSYNGDCQSDFCNQVSEICQTLPLANGESCATDQYCASNVCSGTCVEGLTEGADCSSERCSDSLYCDYLAASPICVAKRQAGELCDSNLECNGSCRVYYGRFRCDTTPATDAVVCDGL